MRHSDNVIFDNYVRNVWFNQGGFGLSKALFTSAKLRYHDKTFKQLGLI